MNKILNIEEVYNVIVKNFRGDGIKVETENEEIYFLISNGQQCCENWGTYLYSPDKIKDYIGAEYLGYDNSPHNSENEINGETCFLNIHTSEGDITYAVYNEHNGYYAHDVVLSITNKKTKERVNKYLEL